MFSAIIPELALRCLLLARSSACV